MRAELVVIGEVVGRWQSGWASERERRDVPATLQEIAAYDAWRLIEHDGRQFAVTAEWLRSKAEYPPLARVRRREWIDRPMPPSFIKLTCHVHFSEEEVKGFLLPGPGAPEVTLEECEEAGAQLAVEDLSGLLLSIVLAANIARPSTLRFDKVYKFINGTFYERDK